MYAMRIYFLYILKGTEDEEGEIMDDDDDSEQSGQDPMIRRQRSSYKKHG